MTNEKDRDRSHDDDVSRGAGMRIPRDRIISYIILRRVIGILGIALPFVCILGGLVFGGFGVQRSVSHYYHTNMRDFLVGLLGCVSLFLFSYKGYNWVDNLITWVIGIAGAGVAVFPCPSDDPALTRLGILQISTATSGLLHLICAGTFFFLLAINSLFLFTLNNNKPVTQQKKYRNAVYIACGVIILVSLAVILILYLAAPQVIEGTSIALVFESLVLCVFGVPWLVKGETFLRDIKEA
jgi:hypothetical protein